MSDNKSITLSNENKSKLSEIAIELGLMTSDLATMIPGLLPYAAAAKLFISGLKAVRLEKQAIEILSDELQLVDKCIIEKDSLSTGYNSEMLDALFGLEKDQTVDEVKFNLLKKLIIVGLTKDEKGQVQAKHFFKTISDLSSTEILLISGCYYFSTKDLSWRGDEGARIIHNWRLKLAKHIGLEYPEAIEALEENLVRTGLLRAYNPKAPKMELGDKYRLTSFGFALCDFAEEYEEIMTS